MMIDHLKIPSPCFVLEERKLTANLKKLASIQNDAGVDIILAFKGFAMWSTFPIVREYLKGATASSYNEVQLCLEHMKCKSHTYMVAYPDHQFDDICKGSTHITFNSLTQLQRFVNRIPRDVSVGLRVNPEWSDVETKLYNPADPSSRLGLTVSQMPEFLPEQIEGLHFHVLCESSAEALREVLLRFERNFKSYLPDIKWLNIGGGHLITKEGYDTGLLINLLNKLKSKYDLKIILEPGSAIAWETGDLYSTVLDIVENGGVKTVITDISFTCHMPDCLEMPYRPQIVNAEVDPKNSHFKYRIGGLSCLAGDYLDEYGFSEPLNVGDPIVFKDMIHYTMVKTTTFNGIDHPTIGILRENGELEVIRNFGYEDYRDRLS